MSICYANYVVLKVLVFVVGYCIVYIQGLVVSGCVRYNVVVLYDSCSYSFFCFYIFFILCEVGWVCFVLF